MVVKKIPLENETFSQIIDKSCLYADKTQYIYELLKSSANSCFFLRPRHFGKTLLLSTIEELLSGNRERFKGLWIDGSDYDFPKHPVISLKMPQSADSPKILRKYILGSLKKIADAYNVDLDLDLGRDSPSEYFCRLVQKLSDATNSEIAILIDDYDAPILSSLHNLELATEKADVLNYLLATLKGHDVSPYVSFTFVTGISRFALFTLESGPNHLVNISQDPEFSGLCGFTMEDFNLLFSDRLEYTLEELKKSGRMDPSSSINDLKAEINKWYGGYSFSGGTRVMNPYSVLCFFRNKIFDNYWAHSAPLAHLSSMIKEDILYVIEPGKSSYTDYDLNSSYLDRLDYAVELYNSGFLTIDKETRKPWDQYLPMGYQLYFSLEFPNYEVRSTYYSFIWNNILKLKTIDEKTIGKELREAIIERNTDKSSRIFTDFFAIKAHSQGKAALMSFPIFVKFALLTLGFDVRREIPEREEESDLLIELEDKTYLIIMIRYVLVQKKLKKSEQNLLLAKLASDNLDATIIREYIVEAIKDKLSSYKISRLLRKSPEEPETKEERYKILYNLETKILTRNESNLARANAARELLDKSIIAEAFLKKSFESEPSITKLNKLLKSSSQEAIKDINTKKYQSIIGNDGSQFVTLGLSIYGYGNLVHAEFALL
ncbi:MAG: AAA family ATPase [Deltaproteobacteria bacterium]|jgi:hypothetical protein|nr:AAA family ATPase [Deltaproteobacteria bacterium]